MMKREQTTMDWLDSPAKPSIHSWMSISWKIRWDLTSLSYHSFLSLQVPVRSFAAWLTSCMQGFRRCQGSPNHTISGAPWSLSSLSGTLVVLCSQFFFLRGRPYRYCLAEVDRFSPPCHLLRLIGSPCSSVALANDLHWCMKRKSLAYNQDVSSSS